MRTKIALLLLVFFVLLVSNNCQKSETRVTTSSPEALALYHEGVSLAEKFHDAQAIQKLNAAIELDSAFVMAYYHLSRTYEAAGNLAEATSSLDKAKQYVGMATLLEWMYINAWDRVLENDYIGAIGKYQEILEKYPGNQHALFVSGKTYRLAKKYPESVAILKTLVDKYPKYAPGYNQLGYTYYEMHDYNQAIGMFKRYAELEPDEPNPYDSLGDMYRSQGDFHEAIKNYQKALELAPNFYASFRNLGLSYFGAGKYDSAITVYDQFLEKFTERELKRDAHSDLVDVYLATGQYRKALEHIDKALELSKTNFRKSWAIAKRGYIHYLMNDFPTALRYFNQSITIFPDAIWAREWRGLVFLMQHNYDQALSEAEKMKTLIDQYGLKGYQCSYNNLLGKAAMEQGLYDEAVMYFKDSMVLDPAASRYPMAIAYFKKGDYQKAMELCQEFFKSNTNHALAHLLLGQIYQKQAKNDLARSEFQKFLDIWKNADKGLPELTLAENALK